MVKMKNKILAQQLRQLVRDINVTVNNFETDRELQEMFYQTEKAINYVFNGQRSGTDKYYGLLDVINAVDKHSAMDLRNDIFADDPIDDPEMRLKLAVLFFTIMRKLIFHIYFLSNFAVRFRSVS
jgi:hypothetical protein